MRYHVGCFRRDDPLVVEVYQSAPVYDPWARDAWERLADECDTLYLRMTGVEGVTVKVGTGQPYTNGEHMARSVRETWTLEVSADNSQHPVWSVSQNVRFRAVHDFYGHVIPRNGFNLDGEWHAYEAQRTYLRDPRTLWPLFVEVYAQAAVAVLTGTFAPQKVFLA